MALNFNSLNDLSQNLQSKPNSAPSNGVGGSDLYNLLKEAGNPGGTAKSGTINPKGFVGQNYAVTNSSVTSTNSNGKVQQSNTGNSVQYDMFNRADISGKLFNSAPAGIQSAQNGVTQRTTATQTIDDRVVINYKNTVKTQIENLNNPPKGQTANTIFLNKIEPYNKYKSNTFKDPSVTTIVSNLNDSPATAISYADFVYCKKLGTAPNNRLVILRRFFQPVDDDLVGSSFANTQQRPMSVMVTWFDEFPFVIKYGEDWTTNANGIVDAFANTLSSLVPNKIKNMFDPGDLKSLGGQASQQEIVSSPWLKTLFYQFVDSLYRSNSPNVPPNFKKLLTEANPNLIRESVIKQGLAFQLDIALEFTYVMRYINGIDPHVAMHNIIANAVRMGTSTSVTLFPKVGTSVPDFVKDVVNGNIVEALQTVFQSITNYLLSLYKAATTPSTDAPAPVNPNSANVSAVDLQKNSDNSSISKLGSVVGTYSRNLFSLYRFKLTAALQADLGLPSGSWHVTVGNPFNPIASVGDLVITPGSSMTMKFNNELSYDDQPTEVTFNISLKAAKRRGAQDIEQIFNAGRGRIYVYPQYDDDPDLYLSDMNPYMTKTNASTTPTVANAGGTTQKLGG